MAERKPVYESIREAARRVGLSYDSLKRLADREAVSYTHLTLPTIYSV